jgi:ABC-type cobalamin/Fe3+-siderophores transport system ATPase subunit
MERPLALDILDLLTQLNERFKTIVIVMHDSYAANFAGYVRHLAERVLLLVNRDLTPLIRKDSLTPAEFNGFFDIPPELEWLANITNPKTGHAYKI